MTERTEIYPGVFRHVEYSQAVYSGPVDALIAAGLVTLAQLPGQAGNGRGMCTYNPDGSNVDKGNASARGPGRKYIIAKKSATGPVFEVRLNLSQERCDAMEAQRVRASGGWPFLVVIGSQFRGAAVLEVRP